MNASEEKPDIYADRLARLTVEEKAQIRQIITSPLWAKYLRVVACKKPSSNVQNGGSRDRDQFSDARCNARLGEIRGWELYEFAMYLALHEEDKKLEQPTETFPDAGRVDSGWEAAVETKKRRTSK
jgi:hypothetical protein